VRDHHRAESGRSAHRTRRATMSVYRVIEVVGTSTTSWEEAAADAIKTAGQSVRDLRVAEVVKQDIHLGDGGELIYRTKIQLSFKYEQGS
jgi:flavin-binding protein dodecin